MKKIIRITESDLTRIVQRVIREQGEENLPIQKLVITTSPSTSFVKLEKGEQYPVKFNISKCPGGRYRQNQIPNNCNVIAIIDGQEKYCNNTGCGNSPVLTTPQINVKSRGKV